jgi:protein involved in polysaccharide export with SLBB domain
VTQVLEESRLNFVWSSVSATSVLPWCRRWVFRLAVVLAMVPISGCGDKVRTPTSEEITAFEQAGPVQPSVDVDLLQKAKLHTGPYRVVPGDVLEFTMPALLQAVTTTQAQAAQTQAKDDRPYICRVSKQGTVSLPAAGEIEVAGETLDEIEEKIVDAYRRFVVSRPSVYVRLLEYKTYRTSIAGAVAKPGVYPLRGDQMSLVALLNEAGGIVEEGAAVIKISRLNQPEERQRAEQASLGPQSSTRVKSGGQGVRLAAFEQETTARRAGGPGADMAVQAVFQREGPLCATGWLRLEKGGEVLARRWLDIGSASQRQTFLQSVAAQSDRILLDDLQMRLSHLAEYLELRSRDSQRALAMQVPGWQRVRDDLFVAYLHAATADGDRDRQGPSKVITEAAVAVDEDAVTTLILPVRGLNIPFRDVGLAEGDTVVVERIQEPSFSVLGLVARPGNFPYPPNVQYNVTQAIAFAQGLDPVANPRYVTIYRLAKDGSIVRVPLKLIEKDKFTEALNTQIKPGDVVAIERTPRTRANTMIHDLLRVNVGLYFTGRDLWDSSN